MLFPEPMTPADCDLRDFQFMPLDIARLFGSEFHARVSDGEWRAGLTLWLKSYHQVPAASLPDDDVALARLAEYGRDLKSWRAVKDGALHGWVKCSDGRLYHPVVAEKVLEGWLQKLHARLRGGKGNAKRWKLPFDAKALEDKVSEAYRLLRDLNPSSAIDQPLMPESSKEEFPSNPSSIHEGSNEHSTEDRKGQGQGQGEEKEHPLPLEGDAAGAAGKQVSKYSDDFESFWREYPKRDRSAPKPDAWKAWGARLKEGIAPQDLIRAAANYRADQFAKGKVGTEFVKLPATFLGKGEHWKPYLGPQPEAQAAAQQSAVLSVPTHSQEMYPNDNF